MRKYSCDAVFELPTSVLESKVNFSIEMSPLGERMVNITFPEPLNYPILPVKKALKDFILQQDKEGHLPC